MGESVQGYIGGGVWIGLCGREWTGLYRRIGYVGEIESIGGRVDRVMVNPIRLTFQ